MSIQGPPPEPLRLKVATYMTLFLFLIPSVQTGLFPGSPQISLTRDVIPVAVPACAVALAFSSIRSLSHRRLLFLAVWVIVVNTLAVGFIVSTVYKFWHHPRSWGPQYGL